MNGLGVKRPRAHSRSPWRRAILVSSMLAVGWAAPAWAGPPEARASTPTLGIDRPTPRMGTHGMLLFGAGRQTYASHIPMFGLPHDMQILMVVTVKHPALLEGQDFSDGTYTLRPQRFDLNDLVEGRLKSFKADVYRGNFEGDGVALFRNALVQVEGVPHAELLSANAAANTETRYWVLDEGCGVYLVHAISGAPDFDQVVKVSLARPVPRSGTDLAVLRLPERKNVSGERLRAGEKLTMIREDGAEVPLTVERELSFLPGPDFAPPRP